MQSLLAWVEAGTKPTPAALAERCSSLEAGWGRECRFRPAYRPPSLDTRVTPRER